MMNEPNKNSLEDHRPDADLAARQINGRMHNPTRSNAVLEALLAEAVREKFELLAKLERLEVRVGKLAERLKRHPECDDVLSLESRVLRAQDSGLKSQDRGHA